jgi:hypothetical protein
MAADILTIAIFGVLALNGLVLVLAVAHAMNNTSSSD